MGMGLKKKKKKLKTKGTGGGGGPRATSALRPYNQEKLAPCMDACPQGTEIRKVLMTLSKAEDNGKTNEQAYEEAWSILTEKNPLPAVCGRVCPHPCEEACNRQHLDEPASINQVERFLGDWGLEKGLKLQTIEDKKDDKIAVVGAGPAGLAAAYHLAKRGYPVTMFEAFDKPGGMLRYGIPAYRLPRDILDNEIQRILDLGVELKTNTAVGRDIPYEQVKSDFRAVFVGLGAHQGRKLGVEGEDSENIWTGAEFLNAVNSGNPPDVGDNVIVIGGGDTAVDAARMSKRLGAKDVTIVYRRTIAEMPAITEEIDGATEEGIAIEFLAAPVKVLAENGKATGMTCIKMELGEPDASGRRRPVPIEGSEFDKPASAIVSAISQEPDFNGFDGIREGRDWVKIDQRGRTPLENVFAGGDVTDLALVTTALAQGRFAAEAIDDWINDRGDPKGEERPLVGKDRIKFPYYKKEMGTSERNKVPHIPVEERFGDNMDREISAGLTEEQVQFEAKRCLSCGHCFGCGTCWSFCQDQAIIKPMDGSYPYTYKLELCQGCKKCEEECPCGFVELK